MKSEIISTIKTILFDLDGTLLPMQQDEFTSAYFDRLSKKLDPCGYEPKRLIEGVWQGTKAMVKNNGKQTNEQVFWKEFAGLFGDKVYSDIDKFNEFYETDFDKLKNHCGYNEQANQTIQTLKEKGFVLVLATNPVFPMTAQKKKNVMGRHKSRRFCIDNILRELPLLQAKPAILQRDRRKDRRKALRLPDGRK